MRRGPALGRPAQLLLPGNAGIYDFTTITLSITAQEDSRPQSMVDTVTGYDLVLLIIGLRQMRRRQRG